MPSERNMAESPYTARFWHALDDGRLQCDLCPRTCKLKDGQRAFCFVRERKGDRIVLTTYGRSTGFCIDPIEKKPLAHFLPGTSVLSFGTAGCCLGCRFCQNWHISKTREVAMLSNAASPAEIAEAAERHRCASVAYTYNDPIVFAEYAIDTAWECRERGIRNVAVTSGFIQPEAWAEFFGPMDAANVDLKAFHDDFYREQCLSKPGGLQDVLDTLRFLVHETQVHVELTTLLIPGLNDSDGEIREEAAWIRDELHAEVPVHFTAFHPAFRMMDREPTPPETLRRARRIALDEGLRHVYTGNVTDPDGQVTSCPGCGHRLIERDGYRILAYRLDARGHCPDCGDALFGVFAERVGHHDGHSVPIAVESTLL